MNHAMSDRRSASSQAGLTLIELMIALVLGLVVVGAAISIFSANRQTYLATESLGRVQENARTGFELIARDLREAAGNQCMNSLPISNVLNNKASRWYTNIDAWGVGIRGFSDAFPDAAPGSGSAVGQRVSGTHAFQIISAGSQVATVASDNTSAATFTLNTASSGIRTGDLVLACNPRQAAIFQATSVSGASLVHQTSGSIGNCSTALGLPACGTAQFAFAAIGSTVANLKASRWYIGNTARGRSLFQSTLTSAGSTSNNEVLEGVTDMQVTYLPSGATAYVAAGSVTDWASVVAVRVELTFADTERVGPQGEVVNRRMIQVVSLRNRNA